MVATAASVSIGAHQKPAIAAPADVAKPPADAQRTPSGIYWKVLKPGTGTTHPTPMSTVTMDYTGWTTDGKMFDSSIVNGKPLVYQLNGLIKGWVEGVQMMVTGEKRRLWIPGNLGYDNNPSPGVPHGMLVFDMELISFK
jgi:peptidylprolyl isomerase